MTLKQIGVKVRVAGALAIRLGLAILLGMGHSLLIIQDPLPSVFLCVVEEEKRRKEGRAHFSVLLHFCSSSCTAKHSSHTFYILVTRRHCLAIETSSAALAPPTCYHCYFSFPSSSPSQLFPACFTVSPERVGLWRVEGGKLNFTELWRSSFHFTALHLCDSLPVLGVSPLTFSVVVLHMSL